MKYTLILVKLTKIVQAKSVSDLFFPLFFDYNVLLIVSNILTHITDCVYYDTCQDGYFAILSFFCPFKHEKSICAVSVRVLWMKRHASHQTCVVSSSSRRRCKTVNLITTQAESSHQE